MKLKLRLPPYRRQPEIVIGAGAPVPVTGMQSLKAEWAHSMMVCTWFDVATHVIRKDGGPHDLL